MTKEVKTILIIGGVVLAIVALLVAVSRYMASNKPIPSEALVREASHFKGSADAPVTLIEFGDFQCPACAQSESVVRQIIDEYPDQVKFVYRHFPLSFHRHAAITAQAAEAAAKQGKFWEMHNMLFDNQASWSNQNSIDDLLVSYAEQIGLDVETFKSDYTSQEIRDIVRADQKDGEALAVSGTPTFFLNGQKLENNSYNSIKSGIDQILSQTSTAESTQSSEPDN